MFSFRFKRPLIILVISFLVILPLLYFSYTLLPQPPVEIFADARIAMSEMKQAKAHIYAADNFALAEQYYSKSMKAWQKENERFIYAREYDTARYYAEQCVLFAKKAQSQSILNSSGLKWYLNYQLDSINQIKSTFQPVFKKLPLPQEIHRQNTRGYLLMHEAESAYKNRKYNESEEKLILAKRDITETYFFAYQLLNDYFENHSEWIKLAEASIKKSKSQKSNLILIDKFAHECRLYQKGVLKYSFQTELGPNWIGDKKMKGDKATPEGLYFVKKKLHSHQTKFYKALLIDYPNNDDAKRFKQLKQQNIIPKNAEIGGLIEIHGSGGKGTDWTDGCAALTNEDMDILYSLVQLNTPVVIIGSLESLDKILLSN